MELSTYEKVPGIVGSDSNAAQMQGIPSVKSVEKLSQNSLDLAYLTRNSSLIALKKADIEVWTCDNATRPDGLIMPVSELAFLVPSTILYNELVKVRGGSPCKLIVLDNPVGFRNRDAIIYSLNPRITVLYVDNATNKQMWDGTLLSRIYDINRDKPISNFPSLYKKL